ncbi:MAG: hypothetical protein U0350_40745 [Caldilineaceae bacterium]
MKLYTGRTYSEEQAILNAADADWYNMAHEIRQHERWPNHAVCYSEAERLLRERHPQVRKIYDADDYEVVVVQLAIAAG